MLTMGHAGCPAVSRGVGHHGDPEGGMMKLLYLAGSGYLAICIGALVLPDRAPLSHSGAAPFVVPGGDDGWFARLRPFCNAVEVNFAHQRSPAPKSPHGIGYSAACYGLAGKI